MKHIMGNSPKCYECKYYLEAIEPERRKGADGWCTCREHLRVGVNGHKRERVPEKEAVMWNSCCSWWTDAESGLTRYEVVCRKPEPWRTPLEAEAVIEALRRG